MELTIEEYDAYSPLSAYLGGKVDAEQDAILGRFSDLPEIEKSILVGTNTAQEIAALISAGILPQSHGKAVAKLIYLVVAGEVPITSVDALMVNLGLTAARARDISSWINTLVSPVISERVVEIASMPELPPLTQKIPPVVPAPDSSKPTGRNIIDLRKQQEG